MNKFILVFFLLPCIAHAQDNSAQVQKYANCIKLNSVKYSKLNEPAEAIAKASVASCAFEMQRAMESNYFWDDLSPQAKEDMVNRMRSVGENLSIKTVMDERVK
ncbi:hypothetical protein N3K64_04865 [Escherichia coli]|uniref:hypothetical protein n=1 Tax=Escherichia coli TaxID=562 RepID=UPI0021C117F3|nr:hypothetical protein [Escherichia coli]MCT9829222.1 hypothetical protein [Escherichia coli]